MKWLIAGDIHGSAYWCGKLEEAFLKEKADRFILLGDLLYHGPRNNLPDEYNPKAVIEILGRYKDKIMCVRGNCEAEVDQMVLPFPVLADYALLAIGSRMVFITHGHKFSNECLPPLQSGDILLNGHTHVPACDEKENYIYMNPGSVSIPKEGSHHGYMTLEDGCFMWKDFEGNVIKEYNI